jgi:hypothetical protein
MSTTQTVCGLQCAVTLSEFKAKKKRERETRKLKHEFNKRDIKWQQKRAQDTFNAYIRERDKNDGCISCGIRTGQFHAGHFLTRGAYPEKSFLEDNVHKQCAQCNRYKSGALSPYRANLIKKIGRKRVLALESYRPVKKMTCEEYEAITMKYRSKLKKLKT